MRVMVDWKKRYEMRDTPWDLGKPHPELSMRLERGLTTPPFPGARALVPGCGHGHDALALARAGWSVTAIDLVPQLHREVGTRLEPYGGTFILGNALSLDAEPFQLLWEHTFFCALDPDQRSAWGAMAARLIAPGGHLEALVFPVDKPLSSGGPPWSISAADLAHSLGAAFTAGGDEPVTCAVEERRWEERFAWFRRNSADGS